MNCLPGQLAWIKVPPAAAVRGVEQLNNRVVRVMQQKIPGIWNIEPAQSFVTTGQIMDAAGQRFATGQCVHLDAIADSWLVPFKGNADPATTGTLLRLPVVEQTL